MFISDTLIDCKQTGRIFYESTTGQNHMLDVSSEQVLR